LSWRLTYPNLLGFCACPEHVLSLHRPSPSNVILPSISPIRDAAPSYFCGSILLKLPCRNTLPVPSRTAMIPPRLYEVDRAHQQTIRTPAAMGDRYRVSVTPCKIGFSQSMFLQKSQYAPWIWISLLANLNLRILEQVVPVEDVHDESVSVGAKPVPPDAQRPAFSLPVMGNNFRRFNAR
jgi:hypothetical protein